MSDVEYKSPTSKVFLGSKSKTCAAGEKKLLLLSHIDEMANQHRYKVWVTDKTPYLVCRSGQTAPYVGVRLGKQRGHACTEYDLATDTENYSGLGQGRFHDLRLDAQVLQRRSRRREGVSVRRFPDAVELCVPTATTELTMVIAATGRWHFYFRRRG